MLTQNAFCIFATIIFIDIMSHQKNITIAGAGLVGTLLSIFLSKRGHRVKLYERRNDMRKSNTGGGRSINLALSDRGIAALEKIGIYDAIQSIALPMPGRFIHNADGSSNYQPYGKEGQFINSVSRATLNQLLLDKAEAAGVEIFFDSSCTQINWTTNEISFKSAEVVSTIKADIIFGADGAFSAARLQHMLQHEKFDYQQFYIDCGYKELTIPATADGDFAMDPNALHIWPRKDYMLIALPNIDKTFTCTLFFPFNGPLSFSALDTPEKIRIFFENNFADTIPLMPTFMEDFMQNPVSSLVTVKCYPWVRGDKFTLLGDAAHAIVPFFGQGMNCGFEDCKVLDELMELYGDDWTKIFEEFQALRKPDADAIATLAVNNFIEMRDRTADPKFLLQKKIEALLHEKYPEEWVPAYTQVTFSPHIRYSEALHNGNVQENIMQEFMQSPDIVSEWQQEQLLEKIIQRKREKIS